MLERRRVILPAFITLMVCLIAVVTVTYAWLGVSRVPFVSDLSLSAISEAGLQIAPDVDGMPGEWDSYLDMSEFFENFVPLRPVTYTPDSFRAIIYSSDGRTNGVVPLEDKNFNVMKPEGVEFGTQNFWDVANEGYMVYVDFWLRTNGGSGASVFLSDAASTEDGDMYKGTYAVGMPVWEAGEVAHVNKGYGMETAVRMGFEWQKTDINANPIGNKTFMMYEPNADVHPGGGTGYTMTPSVLGGALIDNDHLITQAASTWKETDPVLAEKVFYTPGKILQDHMLLRVEQEGMTKVRLYVWVEGQDVDCIARNSADSVMLLANIDFGVKADVRDGVSVGRRDLSKILGR